MLHFNNCHSSYLVLNNKHFPAHVKRPAGAGRSGQWTVRSLYIPLEDQFKLVLNIITQQRQYHCPLSTKNDPNSPGITTIYQKSKPHLLVFHRLSRSGFFVQTFQMELKCNTEKLLSCSAVKARLTTGQFECSTTAKM